MTEVFRPLGDRVLVRPVKSKPREESKLDLGNSAEPEQVLRGELVRGNLTLMVGPSVVISPAGTIIAYAPYSGKEVKINGETLLILTEEEILGVFEEVA